MTHDNEHMPAEACSDFMSDPPELDQGPEMLRRVLIYAIVVVACLAAWVMA